MIEKQTDRKIKILQIDSAREYKNQFIWFGQDNSIVIHFKIEKHGGLTRRTVLYWRRFGICCLMYH